MSSIQSSDNALRHRLGVVEAAVVDGEAPATVLSVDFNKAVSELNIAPAVILLRLNRGRDDRIDSNHGYYE